MKKKSEFRENLADCLPEFCFSGIDVESRINCRIWNIFFHLSIVRLRMNTGELIYQHRISPENFKNIFLKQNIQNRAAFKHFLMSLNALASQITSALDAKLPRTRRVHQ